MSGSVQSLAAGALGLCLLEVALTSKFAPARLAAGAGNAKTVLARIVDPHVPLIGTTASTTAATSTATITPAAGDIPVAAGAAGSVPSGGSLA